MAGLVAAGALGAVLSLAFYGRYVPVFLDMQRGVPMPEEQILLEKLAQAPPPDENAPPDTDDPFAGPGVDPVRGLRKAGWRLYVFYCAVRSGDRGRDRPAPPRSRTPGRAGSSWPGRSRTWS